MEELLAKLRPRDAILMFIVLVIGTVGCFHIWTHGQMMQARLEFTQHLADQGRSPEDIREILMSLRPPHPPHRHRERQIDPAAQANMRFSVPMENIFCRP